MSEESTQQSVVDVLRSDHDGITEQLESRAIMADDDAGRTERTELVMNLVRHFVAEEQYLYPVLRDRVDGGAALAEEGFTASRACEHELRELEAHGVEPEEVVATIAGIRRRFADHVTHQHDVLFPRIVESVDRVTLLQLGEDALGAEQLAPTRPRLFAPEMPGANMLAGLVEGFVDRIRDFYTGRGAR